jgi:NAD(P)-dependent dehydrogenase (short-subunit alcohol dehydrogenase family)
MTDESAVCGMAKAVRQQHGRIDIVVNNADGNIRRGLLEASNAEWRAVLEPALTAC